MVLRLEPAVWQGLRPGYARVGAGCVTTVSTRLDRSSAASVGRRAVRHCDEVLPLPAALGSGLDLSSFS